MKVGVLTLIVAGVLAGGVMVAAVAQEKKPQNAGHTDEGGMGMPKPTKAHEMMKRWEGNWDATFEMMGQKTPATETVKVICNGMWMTSDYKGSLMGMPFEGHFVMGYDPMKKKYTSIWVDSMSYTMTTMTGTYDEATKTYTGLGESMGPGGEIEKMKEVTVDKDSDTRVFTMYKMLDGKESPLFTITYKRRK